MHPKSVYRSSEARDVFRARYQQFLDTMPFTKRYVPTPFGETFLLEAGNEAAPAVLLLHGSCSNSAFWYGDILALKNDFHVFAADIPGEAGNSSEYRLPLDGEDYALWLGALLDALHLDAVHLAGNSLGGWMALRFASAFPARVKTLMLFASSGLAPVSEAFLKKAAESKANDGAALGGAVLPPEIAAFLNLIIESYEPIMTPLPVFSEAALKKLTMPVLYVAGETDDLLDTRASEAALKKSVPHAEIHLLPDAGHLIATPFVWMLPFLQR